jgi:hypothetical protein
VRIENEDGYLKKKIYTKKIKEEGYYAIWIKQIRDFEQEKKIKLDEIKLLESKKKCKHC